MDEHHKEVSGYSRTGCLRCHPDGREADDDVAPRPAGDPLPRSVSFDLASP
jgi:hypothetical protein